MCVSAAWATTFTVTNTNDSGPGSLRAAIEAANANAGADEIVFADGVSGTITLSSTLSKVTDPAGLTIDGGGDVTLHSIVAAHLFVVGQGARLDLRNLTVSGGSPTSADQFGGLIFNEGGTLVVTDSTISGNSSSFNGGGIYNDEGGLVEVSGSTISDNWVDGWGGGIYNEQGGTVIVTDSTFHKNEAGDYGGGVFNRQGGKVEVTDSTFSGNHAADNGAGIANFGTLTVSGSTFSGNFGDFEGGGIYNEGEQLKVTNSTFFGNEGGFGGGGIVSYGGQVEVVNSTISNNTSFENGAGGIYGGLFTLRNTIVANHAGGNCGWSPALPPVVDGGYNVDDDGTCGFTQATGSLPNTDPLLDPAGLVDNGGPTKTIALQPESPAVDLVGQGACPPPATDQRAVERPQGEACDSGAFELEQQATPKPPSVTSTSPKQTLPKLPLQPTSGQPSLRRWIAPP